MSKTAMVKSEFSAQDTSRKSRASNEKRSPLGGLSWRLPSGEGLAEFALKFGFLAPALLGAGSCSRERFRRIG